MLMYLCWLLRVGWFTSKLLTLARACAAKGYCSPSVGRSVGLFLRTGVFSLTVAAVDTKRGYVGMCNGRSAQQESRAVLPKNSMFTAGGQKLYTPFASNLL